MFSGIPRDAEERSDPTRKAWKPAMTMLSSKAFFLPKSSPGSLGFLVGTPHMSFLGWERQAPRRLSVHHVFEVVLDAFHFSIDQNTVVACGFPGRTLHLIYG